MISVEWFRLLIFKKMRTIVFCFALFAVYLCFGESITHPIQKLPWGSEFGFAFTVSDLNNSTNINSEEKLFNSSHHVEWYLDVDAFKVVHSCTFYFDKSVPGAT